MRRRNFVSPARTAHARYLGANRVHLRRFCISEPTEYSVCQYTSQRLLLLSTSKSCLGSHGEGSDPCFSGTEKIHKKTDAGGGLAIRFDSGRFFFRGTGNNKSKLKHMSLHDGFTDCDARQVLYLFEPDSQIRFAVAWMPSISLPALRLYAVAHAHTCAHSPLVINHGLASTLAQQHLSLSVRPSFSCSFVPPPP